MIVAICKLPFSVYDIFFYFLFPKLHFFRFKTRNNEDIYKILAKHDKKSPDFSQV